MDVLSRKAEELGQISPAACCEELIGKHRGMFVDCTALLSDLDPGKMSPELLDKRANRMIEQALDSNPRAIAEAQRKRWAGIKKDSDGPAAKAPAKKKRKLSPEGRKRIIEATKKRWAAVHAAAAKAEK